MPHTSKTREKLAGLTARVGAVEGEIVRAARSKPAEVAPAPMAAMAARLLREARRALPLRLSRTLPRIAGPRPTLGEISLATAQTRATLETHLQTLQTTPAPERETAETARIRQALIQRLHATERD